ncbi:UPF0500 protein C1orf216 homolog [Sphaerodactylus townsendi]|uniref:UPF0500 protein C1orf216 homolog n=1 Tax=Sphaerodactylus townsendi TaxID=933632 RepID=UPI0020273210|nr:UPF0500 protein C1orf216 homolog [Sphaerodactylus townsendi]XP_048356731.1 UPF0500 protein C1orf216 homolog [Sphaerodactylus townsendi]
MFAMCQPEVSLNPLFHEANLQLDTAYLGARDGQPDKNLNFMDEEAYDSNDNWSQTMPGIPVPGELEMLEGNAVSAPDNQTLLLHRQNTKNRPRNVPQGLNSDGVSLVSEEEEDVRRPPEGAEVTGLEQEKTTAEERIKLNEKVASSPLEDNGYASSSLSIDSPDSGGASAWDVPVVATEDQRGHLESKPPDADPERTSPISETLFPALAEAFRNLQDKKKFKEREKEKHHVHLVMYRRLALLRWIRSLQQKVVDQQNRLQESFDTILDNRKELIRYVQQGMVYAKNPAQAEL